MLRVEGPSPWIAHIELQASRDPKLVTRLLQYHALLLHRHGDRVRTTVVLLRPDADGRDVTGRYDEVDETGDTTLLFRYRVIRLWEQPIDDLLTGGLGVLPLAPLAAIEPTRLPEILEHMGERFRRETDPASAENLWVSTSLLLPLRYDMDEVRDLMVRMQELRDTRFVREIREEGRAEGLSQGISRGLTEGRISEARRIVLRLGTRKFGPASATVVSALDNINDLTLFDDLTDRILTATSWQELLETTQNR